MRRALKAVTPLHADHPMCVFVCGGGGGGGEVERVHEGEEKEGERGEIDIQRKRSGKHEE